MAHAHGSFLTSIKSKKQHRHTALEPLTIHLGQTKHISSTMQPNMPTAIISPLILSFLLPLASPQSIEQRFSGPCGVVLERMRYAGYLVRDCAYLDPFVYWRIEHRMTWQGARNACKQVPGGDLISIHTFDEKRLANALSMNNYVNFNLQRDHWHGIDQVSIPHTVKCNDKLANTPLFQGVWLGLRDIDRDGKGWKWSDGTMLDYKDWLTDQPDSHATKEHCVQIITYAHGTQGAVSTGWNDIGCQWSMKAICKVPRISVYP